MGTVTSSAISTSPGPAARPESGSVFSGLSSSEAQRRLTEFGPNEIRREQATNVLTLLVSQFASPVIWLLLVALRCPRLLGNGSMVSANDGCSDALNEVGPGASAAGTNACGVGAPRGAAAGS